MPKLPYTKTTIRDMSQFINIGDGVTGLNIATIINSKTGPMTRQTLTSFDELVAKYCTGTAITQKDDVTIQCIGALLNTSAVDVIRVGTAKIRVGKTDDGKVIYTDEDYNPIEKLSKIKFKENIQLENSEAVTISNITYYIGDEPKKINTATKLDGEKLSKALFDNINEIDFVNYSDSSVIYETVKNIDSTYLTNTKVSYIDADIKLEATNSLVSENTDALIIGDVSYVFRGDGQSASKSWDYPYVDIYNKIDKSANKFLANVIANTNSAVAYDIKYDLSAFEDYSDILKERISGDNIYQYSKEKKYSSLYFVKTSEEAIEDTENPEDTNLKTIYTVYSYNNADISKYKTLDDENEDESIEYRFIEIKGEVTDFASIINLIENEQEITDVFVPVTKAVAYLSNTTLGIFATDGTFKDIRDFSGLYECNLSKATNVKSDFSVKLGQYYYYCGKEPEYEDVIEGISLSSEQLFYKDFLDKLYRSVADNYISAKYKDGSLVIADDIDVETSGNIVHVKTIFDFENDTKNSKFALVAKFPCETALFSYDFIKNDEIEDYDVVNLSWTYNQESGNCVFSFDENAMDNYGTYLYYTRYNEGQYENEYVHILQLNDAKELDYSTTERTIISSFGNEVIMNDPIDTDYASAILKYKDYEDKRYSFIWDAGLASPILEKAVAQVALEKNAQFAPSYPANCKTYEQFRSYHEQLGLDTFEGIEVVPAHKGTYCGSFLTTVPGGLTYMVARINSYRNGSSEFQPLFGPKRGACSAPNLVAVINKEDQQKLADLKINSIVSDINGTYLNFNLTSQKKSSYLEEEQIVYMTNVITQVCEGYNPNIIGEESNPSLWATITNQLTSLLNDRLTSGKSPRPTAFRVVCDDKMNTQDIIEARQVRYKVETQFTPSTAYVISYVDVVRLNSF